MIGWSDNKSSGTRAHSKRRLTGLIFYVAGAALAWLCVTHGVAAVWSVPDAAAAAFATGSVGAQMLICKDVRSYGLRIGAALAALYLMLTALNIMLAGAGIAASVLEDQLGRTSIVRELASAQAQVKSTADKLGGVSAVAQRAAEASALQQQREAASGGSCAAPGEKPSPKGVGPIARLRDADRVLFASMATDANRLANDMRASNQVVESTLGAYSAAHHAETVAAVSAAMDKARTSASASQDIKERSITRLAQWRASQPVGCYDPDLSQRIEALANATYPQVAEIGDMPATPSPGSAAHDLFADIVAFVFKGAPFDWAMWGAPLAGGVIPDILLLLGWAMFAHDRRRETAVVHDISKAALGLVTGWADLKSAADAGMMDEGLVGLARYHVRKSSGLGDTDVLVIPDTVEAGPYLIMAKALLKRGWARYQGMAKASAIDPSKPLVADIAADATCHFFVFGRGIWNRILMEAARLAADHQAAAV